MDPQRKRAFKNALYEQFARVGKALASPARIEMLELLAQGGRTVDQLAAEAALSTANASQHLQVLRRANLVEVTRRGASRSYALAGDDVFRLWTTLRELAQRRLAEIERVVDTYLHARGSLEAVTIAELRSRIRSGSVLLLDVRPEAEYRAGHIPGAVSMPLDQLGARMKEIPRRREVVAYCRGPYCVLAYEAVARLTAHGYKARRFEVGLPEWRLAGLPVATDRAPESLLKAGR
jgi:rhodanese-related sulfurtransferase/DNA-binding MarR family transcriptional regulator